MLECMLRPPSPTPKPEVSYSLGFGTKCLVDDCSCLTDGQGEVQHRRAVEQKPGPPPPPICPISLPVLSGTQAKAWCHPVTCSLIPHTEPATGALAPFPKRESSLEPRESSEASEPNAQFLGLQPLELGEDKSAVYATQSAAFCHWPQNRGHPPGTTLPTLGLSTLQPANSC